MSDAIHPSAICHADAVADDVTVGSFAHVESGATLGRGVRVGGHATVRAGAALADRAVVLDGAIIGEGVRVSAGATIGEGAIITGGATIGEGAVVSPGAVVDRAVPRHAIVSGNPARIAGYVDLDGRRPLEPIHPGDVADRREPSGTIPTAVRGVTLHHLPEVRDLRGSLVAGELEDFLPFLPRRYFLVFDVPGAEVRGEHAHHECHQFLIAVHGELNVIADDAEQRQEFVLDRENVGLYLPPMTWGIQYRQSRDCVLLVFASHRYDGADYIRDYGTFLEAAAARRGA